MNEVKESIINAYSLKSGLSHAKISQLMSAETWMNAKKAKELGFVDEILYQNKTEESKEPSKEEEETEEEKPAKNAEPTVEPSCVLFSRKALEDSFIAKVTDMKPENKVSIESLDKRFSLLSH